MRNDGRARPARSMNRVTASKCDSDSIAIDSWICGVGSDGTRHVTSPPAPNGSRLVASTVTRRIRTQHVRDERRGIVKGVLAVVENQQRRSGIGEIYAT